VGVVIYSLPVYYSTVYVGSNLYYYANNTYYNWQPDQNGYTVVDPPADAGSASAQSYGGGGQSYGGDPAQPYPDARPDPNAVPDPNAPPDSNTQPDYMIYPKNGQSKEQQVADEYDCGNWATSQTGFDTTQPGGGVAASDADRSHGNYDRAMSACLQGRGYQVN
jgi:hypothetical protein